MACQPKIQSENLDLFETAVNVVGVLLTMMLKQSANNNQKRSYFETFFFHLYYRAEVRQKFLGYKEYELFSPDRSQNLPESFKLKRKQIVDIRK